MPFAMQIPGRLYQEMVAHAEAELPNECCGLLAGEVVPGEGRTPVARVVRPAGRSAHPVGVDDVDPHRATAGQRTHDGTQRARGAPGRCPD